MKRHLAALLLLAGSACTQSTPTPPANANANANTAPVQAQPAQAAAGAAKPGDLPPDMVVATIGEEKVTLKDLDEAGFDRTLVNDAVRSKAIEEFYVTLTNGTVVKGYKITQKPSF